MEPKNSGGNGGVLTTVLIISVAGVVGYLIYKAGKGTAAAANGNSASPVYNGTALPAATHAPAGTKPAAAGSSNVSAVAGLLNNVLGLFKKGNTKSAVKAGAGGIFSQSGSGSGGSATVGGGFGGGGSNNASTSNEQGTVYNNNWDNQGGYMLVYADGSAEYYFSDDTYADIWDPIGTWESGGGGSGSGGGGGSTSTGSDTRYDNNWDNQGGYMIVYPDGSAEYYFSDDTYADIWDPIGTWQ